MTDTPFAPPPAGSAVVTETEEETAPNRRPLLIGGIAAAAALVLVLAYLLLAGGSTSTSSGPVAVVHHPRGLASPSPAPLAQVPAPFAGHLGRDPFKPLYVAPVVAAAGPAAPVTVVIPPAGTSTGTTSTTTSTTTRTTSGSTASPAPSTSSTTTSSTTTSSSGTPTAKTYPLKLVSVSSDGTVATFLVNGHDQLARPGTATQAGTRFGPTAEIELLTLRKDPQSGRWVAGLEDGDSRFDAPLGQQLYVP